MKKKVIGFIGFGLSMLILLLYLISTFMAPLSDGKAMLIVLAISIPFLILGLIGILLKNKVLGIIFMALGGCGSVFLGLMSLAGGMPFVGILALPLGIVTLILYIISSIFAGMEK